MIVRTLLILFLTTLLAESSIASDVEAFGYKLGQKIEVTSLEKVSEEENGGTVYKFKPDNPNLKV